uniref:Ras-GAP domain-containing protein n=2 Tax=Kalmanozyma brasiliensis (strain GHG001) TaxID=1365824 RepID=V5EUT3_KALBG
MFGFRNHGPSWLREKPSKGRLNAPTASIGPQGQWKRATLLFRDAGSLSILDETNALSHSLDCGALYVSDVRFVHDSLFARPYVLMIQPRQSRARTEVSITTRKQEAALLQERARSSEPIFIECKSEQEAHYVRTLLHIYVKPEIFGSPATVDTGGSHRFFRQLDITISDAQSIMPKWPADLADSASDSSATPSMSPRPPAPMPPPLPASPTSATVLELPRSLSHQLASLRSEDQEDSPGSEPLTDDTLSGSSRAGSRPSSRQRHHNASTSSLRASRDPEKQSRSPAASRPTSRYDASFQKGIDAASSSSVHISGPLSGDSGASRFDRNPAPSLDETAPSLQTSVAGGSGRGATSRAAAALRREDKDRFEKTRFERYCRIRLDGDLVARTSLAHSSGNAFAVDKFQLKDVGDVKSLFIEVLHPTLRTSSALSGTPAHSSTKFMMLGIVEIPIETLRRNEEIEGRFPIWSISTFSHYTAANEDDGKTPTGFHRGVVGELSLSIHLHEGAILPLTMYEEVYNRLHDEDAHQMLRHLFTLISDDVVVSHVVRICAASGTITSRISTLIEEESVNWGEKMEPELLFRANTSLSRSVDHFQRLLALSWLEACLGPTVRKICNDAQPRSDAAASSSSSSTTAGPTAGGGGGGGSDDGPFDFSTSIRAAPTLPANAIDAIPDGPMTANSLRKLSETMWQNIYSQRHSCPADLRTVLHRIRRKVNECYRDAKSTRPGIQGVGAFVFLRLFCAALNAPQLYGLTPSQPGRDAQRKLLLLSKVLLALASKKNAFDREKDWELIPLNDFLRTYSSAYDDYISVVSTEPPTQTAVQLLGMRIEGDSDLQAAAQRKLGSLCTLHREAIPRAPYMLDQPQALASFVALVADAVEERELAGVTQQPISTIDASSTVDSRDGSAQTEAAKIKQKADEFIAICCRIEEAAGMCIELAGYDPRPIPFERLQRSALSSLPRYGRGPDDATLGPSPSRIAQGDAAVPLSPRDASLGSSPARSRSRRATVGAALALPKLAATKEFHPDGSSEQPVPVPVSPREAREDRRKSVGTPRSNQHRVSQVVTDSPEYRVTAGADPLARRESEANKKSNVQHVTAQSLGTSGTFDVATPSSYRTRSSRLIEDEDDHGSDVELREAYRKLRAEEEAGVSTSQRVAAPGLPAISTTEGPLPRSAAAGNGKAQPSRTPEALDALMEAEDGSTFEPVYAPRTLPRTVGSRASFSGKLIPVRRPALDRPSAPEPNRRHSSEEPEAPRNFSLPRPSADRNSAAIREREESSDGFEMAIEDAYAQTRATLPPSASMPVNMTGLAPVGDGRYGKEFGSGTDGAGKKKKWWKP